MLASPTRNRALKATLLAAITALALAAPALAAPPAFKESVTYIGATQPWGLAFDSSGNLFAADPGAHGGEGEIFKLSSSNALVTSFRSAAWELPFVRSVAVNDATGNVYVADSGTENLFMFKPNAGTYKQEQQFVPVTKNYMYTAFDNSSGPNGGKLYVSESQTTISRYGLNGSGEIQSAGKGELTPPLGGFGLLAEFVSGVEEGAGGMAVDPSTGKLYAAEGENSAAHKAVAVYSPSDVFVEKFSGSETPAGEFVPVGVAVDPTTHNLYVIDGKNKVVDIFKEVSGAYKYAGQLENATNTAAFSFTNPLGIAVQRAGANKGDVYVSDGNHIDVFSTPKFKLTVTKSGTAAATGKVTSTPAGISCGADCEEEYSEGTIVTLKEEPEGSEFKEWTGCESNPTPSECKVTLSAVKSVNAKFDTAVTPKFKLTVSKSGTGSGTIKGGSPAEPNTLNCGAGAGCEHEYLSGAVVTLTHEAAVGSEFKEWTGACSGSGACEVTMSAAKSVGAKFDLEPAKFKLTVTKSGNGSGTVLSVPAGIECGATCSHEFTVGTQVELTRSPASGSEFKEWTGACTGSGTCKVTMSAAKTVGAVFNTSPVEVPKTCANTPSLCPPPPPPPVETCTVPKLAKKTLSQAKSALKAAHCTPGKVTKPKKHKGTLVVKSSSPAAGKVLPAGSKVNLKLGPKPKKK